MAVGVLPDRGATCEMLSNVFSDRQRLSGALTASPTDDMLSGSGQRISDRSASSESGAGEDGVGVESRRRE